MASEPSLAGQGSFAPAAVLTRLLNFAIERDPLVHQACQGLAGRVLRLQLESSPGRHLDWCFAADGLLEAVSLSSRQASQEAIEPVPPCLVLTLQPAALKSIFSTEAHGVSGIRIEGDAALAERLGPLVAVLREKVSLWRLALASHPIALAATETVLDAATNGRFVLTRAQVNDTAQRLRRLREGLDRLEQRLALVGHDRPDRLRD